MPEPSIVFKRPGLLRSALVTCAALALLAPLSAQGAPGQRLGVADAIATAFAGNPELAAARQEIGVADGERQQAGLLPNPELSWEVEDTRRNTSTTTVMLSQALELGGKRGARIDVASRGQQAAGIALENQSNQLRADVMQAFYAAGRAQTALQLARQSQQLAERGLQVAEGRIRAGQASPVEATRAQVQLAEIRLQVQRAETLQASSYRELGRVMGGGTYGFEQLDDSDALPAELPLAGSLLARLEQSAELRLAEARIDQGEASLGSQRALRVPDLTVSIGSQYSREDRERVNVVGLSMPLPLFDRNQGNVLAASRRADQARDLRNAVELRLRTQTQAAVEQWATAAREVQSFTQVILPAAQQAVDTATRGFEMGKFGFLEVLDAQRTLITARSQYLESLATGTEARVALVRIFGESGAQAQPQTAIR